MNTKTIEYHGMQFEIPEYYASCAARPSNPPDSVSFVCVTEHGTGYLLCVELAEEDAWPREREKAFAAIRTLPSRDVSVLEAGAGDLFAYGIFKLLNEKGELNYCLSFQRYFGDRILQLRGIFSERGEKGWREKCVFQDRKERGLIANEENPNARWYIDGFNVTTKRELIVNVSELLEYDRLFPDTPLSLCRELASLLRSGAKEEKKEEPEKEAGEESGTEEEKDA